MLLNHTITASCISLALLSAVMTQPSHAGNADNVAQAIEEFQPSAHIEKAVAMLKQHMEQSSEKRIPATLLQAAKCTVVFPQVVQAGLGIGGKFGRGMMSCRQHDNRWGAPVFLRLNSITLGVQAGGQVSDVIMLVMQDKGLDLLFSGKPIVSGVVGGVAGVAAGPVARSASTQLDLALQSPIVTYSRTKGLFAGVVWESATITAAKEVNQGLFGAQHKNSKTLLFSEVKVPESVQGLQHALEKYASKEV